MLIISPPRAEALARQGMSKEDVRRFLQQNAVRPARGRGTATQVFQPGTIDVVVAGGDAAPMMQAWHMYRPQTASIDKWR